MWEEKGFHTELEANEHLVYRTSRCQDGYVYFNSGWWVCRYWL